jgi:hypothetical protein
VVPTREVDGTVVRGDSDDVISTITLLTAGKKAHIISELQFLSKAVKKASLC